MEPKLKNHVDLVELLGIANVKKGANVAGGRGFYLKGDGVRLNQALINFALDFYGEKGVHCIANSILYEERYHGKVCSVSII
ncbi:unnamed protein product [Camellia sinensis]